MRRGFWERTGQGVGLGWSFGGCEAEAVIMHGTLALDCVSGSDTDQSLG